MPIRRKTVLQHSVRHQMYSGAEIKPALQRLTNDVDLELDGATETGVENNVNFTRNCKCSVKQKRLLKYRKFSNNYTVEDENVQNISNETENKEEDYENSKNNSDFEKDIKIFEINPGNIKANKKILESNLRNVLPECDDSENDSDNDENWFESNDKTEHEFQSDDELEPFYGFSNDNERVFKHSQIYEPNDATALSGTDDKFKIRILDNIIVKNAKSIEYDEVLQENVATSDLDVLENSNGEISGDKNTALESNETPNWTIKLANRNEEKAVQFDNFKVPKTHSKKIKVKKKQPRFVLTHVVGGYIIQESNYAFPIRDPQIQEPIPKSSNTKKSSPEVRQEEIVDEEESSTEDKVPTTPVCEEKEVVRDETGIEEFVPPTEVNQEEEFIQDVNWTEEPLPPIEENEVNQEETGPAEWILLTEVTEEDEDAEADTGLEEYVSPTEVNQEVVQEEFGTEELFLSAYANQDAEVVQGENVTEEWVSPTEVNQEGEFYHEENGAEELVLPTAVTEEEYVQEGEASEDWHPFGRIQQSTVKSWTVEDLSTHLQQYAWNETASLLQDNEIDGASLFMVTKTQLMIIGVSEEHADAISDFVQSGPFRGN